MNKRIIASAAAVAALLGLGGTAVAAQSGASTYDIKDAALSLATDPAPPAPAQKDGGKRQQLKDCVKAKVDGGADKRTSVKDCATQLGVTPRVPKAARLLRKAVHAEVVVPKKGTPGQFETVQLDRGKVTAASADSISLQRTDGPTVTLKVTADTKVKGAASAAQIAPGREAAVVSAAGDARSIVARP